MDWSPVTDWLTQHGWRILLIIVVAIVVYLLLRRLIPPILRRAVAPRMRGQPDEEVKKRSDTLSGVLVKTGVVIIVIIALFTILAEVGVNIAPALAGVGIAGIAIGFGAQSLVKDFISGLFILLENQYSVGDVVKIADIAGIVEEINLRRTVLRDLDGIVHSVPNGEISVASNYTKEWSRVNLNISVGYGEDLDRVMEVINRIGKEMAEDPYWGSLMLTPPQALRVDAFEDSGIAIKILGDTKPIQQWAVMGELRKRIKKTFDEEGIEIPWPHTKVYFGGPLEQQMAKAVERKPSKREEVPEEYETKPTEKVLPPESEEE
ncbi:MAG: mechanosensitive ion channel family protein [Dehalococcoidia bacterium]|nr:MAG: mechanosensitive ion channel family protein [Dehalococcoidia bacterium]